MKKEEKEEENSANTTVECLEIIEGESIFNQKDEPIENSEVICSTSISTISIQRLNKIIIDEK